MTFISLRNCIDGHLYKIRARNGHYGVFNKDQSSFTLAREKFGEVFLFDEFHHDTGPPFGTVKPHLDLGLPPEGDRLPYLKKLEREWLISFLKENPEYDGKNLLKPWEDCKTQKRGHG